MASRLFWNEDSTTEEFEEELENNLKNMRNKILQAIPLKWATFNDRSKKLLLVEVSKMNN